MADSSPGVWAPYVPSNMEWSRMSGTDWPKFVANAERSCGFMLHHAADWAGSRGVRHEGDQLALG